MIKEFKHQESTPTEQVRFNLEVGAIIHSKSGTTRKILEINSEEGYLIVERWSVGSDKSSIQTLNFEKINEGIDNITYIEHPDGTRDFQDPNLELLDLQETLREKQAAFERNEAIIEPAGETKRQEDRVAELKAQLGK